MHKVKTDKMNMTVSSISSLHKHGDNLIYSALDKGAKFVSLV